MTMTKQEGLAILGVTILIVGAVIFIPLAAIWSLNTLFTLGISYTWKTWLAALILAGVLNGSNTSNKKS